jgi:hypothetical protein
MQMNDTYIGSRKQQRALDRVVHTAMGALIGIVFAGIVAACVWFTGGLPA